MDNKGAKDRYEVFTLFQKVLAFLHLGAALAFGILVAVKGDWTVPVVLNFNSWRKLADDDGEGCGANSPCFVVPYKTTLPGELSLGVASCLTSVISGLHHLYAALYQETYKKMIKQSIIAPRWIDYGLSSPLMFLVVSVLWSAPPDLRDIVFGFGLQFLVILGGYGSEVANAFKRKFDRWFLFAGAGLAYLATWVYLFVVFGHAEASAGDPVCGGTNATSLYAESDQDTPSFVYAILFSIFIVFSCFAFVHWAKLWKGDPDDFNSNLYYEMWYSVLSFTSKIVLLGLLTSGVIGRSDGSVQLDDSQRDVTVDDGEDDDDEFDWDVYGTLIGTIVFSGVLGAYFFYRYKKAPKAAVKNKNARGADMVAKLVF